MKAILRRYADIIGFGGLLIAVMAGVRHVSQLGYVSGWAVGLLVGAFIWAYSWQWLRNHSL